MAATSRALIAVTKDAALKERAVALAATLGMTENEVGEDLSAVTDEHLLFALRQALKDKKEN